MPSSAQPSRPTLVSPMLGLTPALPPRTTLTLPHGVSFLNSAPPTRTVSKDTITGIATVRIDYPVAMVVGQPAVSAALNLRMESTLTSGAEVAPDTTFGISAPSALFPTSALTGSPTFDGPVILSARTASKTRK